MVEGVTEEVFEKADVVEEAVDGMVDGMLVGGSDRCLKRFTARATGDQQ